MSKLSAQTKLLRRKNRVGYIFVLPLIIGLAVIFLPTILTSLYYAFSSVDVQFNQVVCNFIGLKNFHDAFFDDIYFRQLLLTSLRGMLIDTIIILLFSFFVATVLNQKFFGRGAARMVLFLPVILTTGLVASADAGNMMMELYGAANNSKDSIATAFGSGGITSVINLETIIESINLSPDLTQTILYAIDNTYKIVSASGVQILIFLSALQSISPSFFEAAKVEGATKWEEFWKITFPLLTPMILVSIVYTIVDAFVNPAYKVLEYIQDQSVNNNAVGYASSLAWIFFVIILLALGLIWVTITKRIKYLD